MFIRSDNVALFYNIEYVRNLYKLININNLYEYF